MSDKKVPEILADRGWHQGYYEKNRRVCLLGALRVKHFGSTIRGNFGSTIRGNFYVEDDVALALAYQNDLRALENTCAIETGVHSVAIYNDRKTTTYEDVVLLAKKAGV